MPRLTFSENNNTLYFFKDANVASLKHAKRGADRMKLPNACYLPNLIDDYYFQLSDACATFNLDVSLYEVRDKLQEFPLEYGENTELCLLKQREFLLNLLHDAAVEKLFAEDETPCHGLFLMNSLFCKNNFDIKYAPPRFSLRDLEKLTSETAQELTQVQEAIANIKMHRNHAIIENNQEPSYNSGLNPSYF